MKRNELKLTPGRAGHRRWNSLLELELLLSAGARGPGPRVHAQRNLVGSGCGDARGRARGRARRDAPASSNDSESAGVAAIRNGNKYLNGIHPLLGSRGQPF